MLSEEPGPYQEEIMASSTSLLACSEPISGDSVRHGVPATFPSFAFLRLLPEARGETTGCTIHVTAIVGFAWMLGFRLALRRRRWCILFGALVLPKNVCAHRLSTLSIGRYLALEGKQRRTSDTPIDRQWQAG